ncbi:mismatch-specific DNA-glycosylase [Paenibacillus wulumuqiensis]|uniref:mismatch-specific DNA-glycosylase n=1 Tax=Paenibacillus wulumuqiensis TaxID=1567107 RepID=UPI000619E64C|nr:mismatch-specific DNA-glycosylase [Paenibacillus wulumuqiensis]
MPAIADHLQHNLSILFIGFNPSLRSGEVGHHYANPRNRFWQILYRAGITPHLYHPEEDGDLLELGYGFTNIVSRPTRGAEDILPEEYRQGREELRHKLSVYQPRIACFVGKGVYTQYSQRSQAPWGFQDDPVTPGIHEFVAPSSSGLVRIPLDDIVHIYSQLRERLSADE